MQRGAGLGRWDDGGIVGRCGSLLCLATTPFSLTPTATASAQLSNKMLNALTALIYIDLLKSSLA